MSTEANLSSREDLFLSHGQIWRIIGGLIEDTPNVDGGDYYTAHAAGYQGWRDGLPAFSENYLRGFREGLKHAQAVVLAGGGSSASAIADTLDEECSDD